MQIQTQLQQFLPQTLPKNFSAKMKCKGTCKPCLMEKCKLHGSYIHHPNAEVDDVCIAGCGYATANCDYCGHPCRNRYMLPYSNEKPYHTLMGPVKLHNLPLTKIKQKK